LYSAQYGSDVGLQQFHILRLHLCIW